MVSADLANIFYSTIVFNIESNDPLNNDMHLVVLAWQSAVFRAEEYQSTMAEQPRMIWNIMAEVLRVRKGPLGELVESIIEKAVRIFFINPAEAVPSSYRFADGEIENIVDMGESALTMKYMQLILFRIQELAAVNHYVYNPVSLSSAHSLAQLKVKNKEDKSKDHTDKDKEGWTQVGSKSDKGKPASDSRKPPKLLTNLATKASDESDSGGKARVTSDRPKPFHSGDGPECATCGLNHTPPKTGCDVWNPKTRQLSISTLLKFKKHMRVVGAANKVVFNFQFTDHLRDYCMVQVMGIDNRSDRNRLIGDLIAAAAELPATYLPSQKVNQVKTESKGDFKAKAGKDQKTKYPESKTSVKQVNQTSVISDQDGIQSEEEDWTMNQDD